MSSFARTPYLAFAGLLATVIAVPQSYAQDDEITVKEWDVPTPGSVPHDIVADSNGIVWYTAIGDNKIGRFDQGTGTLHEYDMPTPNTTSRFIYADSEGRVWFPTT